MGSGVWLGSALGLIVACTSGLWNGTLPDQFGVKGLSVRSWPCLNVVQGGSAIPMARRGNGGGPAAFRRRKRAAMHAEAEQSDTALPEITEHPDIPREDAELIGDASALEEIVAALRAAGTFAFDTEFIGEETFYPRICLIQVATTERLALIDPFQIEDLGPIWEAVADKDVETIVHDGGQDLDPVRRYTNTEPQGIVDTQVCAAFLDMPWPSSLAKIVERFTGHQLSKGHTFTEWDRRPLSSRQIRYAADDVRFLPRVWDVIRAELEKNDRLDWATAECVESRRRGTGEFDAERQMKRLGRGSKLRPRTATVLRQLVLMRHDLAKELDLPHRIALSDEALNELMKVQPADMDAMAQCRNVPRRVINEHGERILAAVKRGCASDPLPMEHRRPSEETAEDRMRIDALWSVLSLHCLARGISPMLVLSRADLARWYLDRRDGNERRLFKEKTWRDEVVGKWFEHFLCGQQHLDVEFKDGRPIPGT